MADLKLQVLDAEDLGVISAHCQDAVVRVADLVFLPRERRFALLCGRFDWTKATAATREKTYQRRQSGLRFEAVTRAQIIGFDPRSADGVLVLLAITFVPTVAPAGQITLQFAAGCGVRLDVEYIEGELKDLGAAWATSHKPNHAAAELDPALPEPTVKPLGT